MNDESLSEMGSDRHLLTLGREVLISEGRALIKLSDELRVTVLSMWFDLYWPARDTW